MFHISIRDHDIRAFADFQRAAFALTIDHRRDVFSRSGSQAKANRGGAQSFSAASRPTRSHVKAFDKVN
jgi:hypothetical protein